MPNINDSYQTVLSGLDLDDMIDNRTAERHINALRQLTSGVGTDPMRHLDVTFPPVTSTPTLITITNIPYVSICSHHMLPFWGTATIGYLPRPDAKIVGLSKIARTLNDYAARPQIQEQLGQQMLDALTMCLDISGAAIIINGTHTCMALRGIRTGTTAQMTTLAMTGDLNNEPWRTTFMINAQMTTNPR